MSYDPAARGYRPMPPSPPPPPPGRDPRLPEVNVGRLWAGGLATALVAAAIAVVGLMIVRGIFGIEVRLPGHGGSIIDATSGILALVSAVAALVATALLNLLLVSTPSPRQFFSWIVGLATVIAAIWPFSTGMELNSKLAGAGISLVIGAAIASLLSSVAASATVYPRHYP
jgi:Family of unknown function (DUF6069)